MEDTGCFQEVNVAVFGGAFNPPTFGHSEIVKVIRKEMARNESLIIDEVLVVPCAAHPFGKSLALFRDRVNMCKLAFGDESKVEEEIQVKIKSDKTYDLMVYLSSLSIMCHFFPVIGTDEAKEIHHWYEWEKLLYDYKMIVVDRPVNSRLIRPVEIKYRESSHYYLRPDPAIPITSSSQVRTNFKILWPIIDSWTAKGWGLDSMYNDEFSGLICREVFDYIVENRLYAPEEK